MYGVPLSSTNLLATSRRLRFFQSLTYLDGPPNCIFVITCDITKTTTLLKELDEVQNNEILLTIKEFQQILTINQELWLFFIKFSISANSLVVYQRGCGKRQSRNKESVVQIIPHALKTIERRGK